MTVPLILIYDLATQDRCNKLAWLAQTEKLGQLFPERWRRFENLFVSSEGRVTNSEKKLLTHTKAGRGYACVNQGFGTFPKTVHSMVLKSFRPNPFPKYYDMCDHKNRCRMDPRLDNLRWSNVFLNGLNKTGTKGYEAIKRDGKLTGKFGSRIRVQRKRAWLGTFSSKEEALQVYKEALERAFEILEI